MAPLTLTGVGTCPKKAEVIPAPTTVGGALIMFPGIEPETRVPENRKAAKEISTYQYTDAQQHDSKTFIGWVGQDFNKDHTLLSAYSDRIIKEKDNKYVSLSEKYGSNGLVTSALVTESIIDNKDKHVLGKYSFTFKNGEFVPEKANCNKYKLKATE